MLWEELVDTYAPQFNHTTAVPAKPVRQVLGALVVKQRLGRSNEETVEQIREKLCIHFFLWLCQLLQQYTIRPINESSFSLGPSLSKSNASRRRISIEIMNTFSHGAKPSNGGCGVTTRWRRL